MDFDKTLFYETTVQEEIYESKEFKDLVTELKTNEYEFDENVARNLLYLLDYAYHKLGISYVSDDIFEDFEKELKTVLKNVVMFNQHLSIQKLPYNMPSLEKVYNNSFIDIEKRLNSFFSVMISSKLDGVSCLLVKKNNKTELYTKGDGENGRNISYILKYINIDQSKIHNKYVMRGELIIKKENGKYFTGDKSLRSKIIGLINRDYKKYDENTINLLKYVDLVFYSIYKPKNYTFFKQFNSINEMGLSVVKHNVIETSEINQEFLERMYEKYINEEIYDIDGLVISDNDKGYNLMENGKVSEFMFAFKQNKFSATTTVLDIMWQKSIKGVYIPVIVHEPIKLDKNTYERVTGHNAGHIKKMGIGIGSVIKVVLRGDVIPKIEEVLKKSSDINVPKDAYFKGINLVTDVKDNEIVCRQIEKWFNVFNIRGISYKTILNISEKLYEYDIEVNDIITFSRGIDRFMKKYSNYKLLGEKKDVVLIDALKKIRETPISIVSILVASDFFDLMSHTKMKTIFDGNTDLYKIIENGEDVSEEQFLSIHGVGEIVYNSFMTGLEKFNNNRESYTNFFNIDFSIPNNGKKSLKIVFTEVKNRDRYLIVFEGLFKMMESVTKDIDYLVTPNTEFKETTKFQRAKKFGIKIITIEEFLKIMNDLKFNISL